MKISSIDKIKYFMRFKSQRIETFLPGYGQLYWTIRDEEQGLKTLHSPDLIWNQLVWEINYSISSNGLRGAYCPFCIDIGRRKQQCGSCCYGQLHLGCDLPGSDFRKVFQTAASATLLFQLLPFRWYRRMIRLIEEM